MILYGHIVDCETLKLMIKNASYHFLCILRHHKLDHLIDSSYNNYFLMDFESQMAYNSKVFPQSSYLFSDFIAIFFLPITNSVI